MNRRYTDKNSSCNTARKSSSKTQKMQPKRDVKECLNLIENGELHLVDVKKLSEDLESAPHLGDSLQYVLHNYCKKNTNNETNTAAVIQLAELCYSKISISNFSNMERFVGCVFYICAYLLKKEKCKTALNIISCLTVKKCEILELSKESAVARSFICNLHSIFIASAVQLASKTPTVSEDSDIKPQELAIASLNVFQFMNVEDFYAGKKVLKTSKLYFQTAKKLTGKEISHMFGLVKNVLSSLLPQFHIQDYYLLYLHKMDQVNFSESSETKNHLNKIIHFLAHTSTLTSELKTCFEDFVECFFASVPEAKLVSASLKVFDVILAPVPEAHIHFLLVSLIFSLGIPNWSKNLGDALDGKVSVDFLKSLFKRMIVLHTENFRNKKFYCSSSVSFVDICFGDLLTGNLQKIQYMIRLCIKNKIPDALSLTPLCREAFSCALQCVETMKMTGCLDLQRATSWKHSVIHHTNVIEDILKQSSSDESWLCLKNFSEELLKEIVNSEFELPYDFRRVTILFQRWHYANLKLKKFMDALYVCSVYYVLYPEEETEVMSMWLQTKSECGSETIEEMTMTELMKTWDLKLKQFSKKYQNSQINMKAVLLMELTAYSFRSTKTFRNPASSFKLSSQIWKQLQKCKPNMWETAYALSCLVATKISGDDDKLPKIILNKCKNVLQHLTSQKYEKCCRSLLHAANLTFLLFFSNVKAAEVSDGQLESSQMVLDFMKKEEEEKVKLGKDVDLNLTCSIVPMSNHLTVELETNYLNELKRIVEMWNEALINCTADGRRPVRSEFELWLQMAKHVANFCELMGEYEQAAATWLLFYKIAKIYNNLEAKLIGLSHLLEITADVDDCELMKEANEISEKLSGENKEKSVLAEFWLIVASNYLKNKKLNKCLEWLNKAKKAVESFRVISPKTLALKANFWCLVSQYLCIAPEERSTFGYRSQSNLRFIVTRAFLYASARGRNELLRSAAQGEAVELLLTMIRVSLWAFHFFYIFSRADYMRGFLNDLYLVVQKLFLPTRTAEILVRLAEVDMLCEKYEDWQEKVIKLKSILITTSADCVKEKKKDVLPRQFLETETHDLIQYPTRPVSPTRFLDEGDPRNSSLSPFHKYLADVKLYETKAHFKMCKCRPCKNILIQILTANTLALESELCRKQKQNCPKTCVRNYNRARDIMTHLEDFRAEQSAVFELNLRTAFSGYTAKVDFQVQQLRFHTARFLIRHALFECAHENKLTDYISNTVEEIGRVMNGLSFEKNLLAWAFLKLQLCCCVFRSKTKEKPKKKNTPQPYKKSWCTKTPFVAHTSKKTDVKVKQSTETKEQLLESTKNKLDHGGKNHPNKAFTGENYGTTKKINFQPKKLDFHATEPGTNV